MLHEDITSLTFHESNLMYINKTPVCIYRETYICNGNTMLIATRTACQRAHIICPIEAVIERKVP